MAWLRGRDCGEKPGDEGEKVSQSVRRRYEDNDRQIEPCKIVLLGQFAVDGDKHVELCGGQTEQFAISFPSPSHARNRLHFMADDVSVEPAIHTLIEQ